MDTHKGETVVFKSDIVGYFIKLPYPIFFFFFFNFGLWKLLFFLYDFRDSLKPNNLGGE